LNNFGVIPGKPGVIPAFARRRDPESRCKGGFETRPYQMPTAFAGMTVGRSLIYFANFGSRTLADRRHYKA
jgi:hypothetical protein